MQTLKIGISPCPNDVFIFAGMILGRVKSVEHRFEFRFEDVETLNRLAQEGKADVVKISYANYLRCESEYERLRSGGALGRGCGPLLLMHGTKRDDAREMLVPGRFTTANFLLDFYAQKPLRRRYLPFDALYEELCRVPGAQGVVIHEKRFTYAQDGLTLLADLGQYWEEQTGYAIPLGAIIVKRALGIGDAVDALIRESLQWAYRNEPEAFALCREYAQDLNPEVIRAHIDLYVNTFSEDLGTEGQTAVTYFLEQQRRFEGTA